MKTITYTDLEGGAPVIKWHGREFTSTVPVEVDDEKDGDLIKAAEGNRFFKVEDDAPAPEHDETIVGKGEAAAREGKKRLVPPAYRGEDKKPQADAWLYGYDRVPQNDDPFAEQPEQVAEEPQPIAPVEQHSAETPTAPVSPTQILADEKKAD